MNTFWLWTAFALLLVAIYAAFVWQRSRGRDRFRARLTVLFLAFALIPSALTIFILSNMLSRSVETLFLPNVEPTLNEALETLRAQILQEDTRWARALQERGLEAARADSTLLWLATSRGDWKVVYGDSAAAARFLRKHPLPAAKATSLHQNVTVRGTLARIYGFQDTTGTVWLACRRYPAALARVFEDLQETLRVYGTLALLREGVVRQQLIWGFGAALVLILAVAAVLAARAVSRSVAEPVAQLSNAMSRVSQGDLNIRVTVRGDDEIA
ncbi:MAG: HAMP domain-containing protein, partial [Calditrichaeota bacterium]|nr:HAMP domain-containing protein [Calditrichota bacterium]